MKFPSEKLNNILQLISEGSGHVSCVCEPERNMAVGVSTHICSNNHRKELLSRLRLMREANKIDEEYPPVEVAKIMDFRYRPWVQKFDIQTGGISFILFNHLTGGLVTYDHDHEELILDV